MSHIKKLNAFLIIFLLFLIWPLPTLAATSIKITDPIASRFTWPPGEVFVTATFNLNYQGGKVMLSSAPDGTGNIWVDDAIDINNNTIRFDNGCTGLSQTAPKDISSFFTPGDNQVQIRLKDICGGSVGSSALYLVNVTTPIPTSTPVPSPTSAPLAKTPLIIIPGFGGSELKVKNNTHWSQPDGHGGTFTHDYKAGDIAWVDSGQAILPGHDDFFDILKLKSDGLTPEAELELTGSPYIGPYGTLYDYFKNNGYTPNKNLFYFSYDWRKDSLIASGDLAQKIQDIKNQTGASKVDIIAHSMGGLVVRSYISNSTRAQNLRKLITLGAPYLGTPKILNALIYGDCLKLDIIIGCLSIAPSEVKDVVQNLSGGYQLAPSTAFYKFYDNSDLAHLLPFKDDADVDNNNITGPLNYDQTKTLLTNLKFNTALYSFNETLHKNDDQIFSTNGIDTTFIVGTGLPTIGQIVERNIIDILGIKVSMKDLQWVNGDATTPLFSGSLNDSSKNLALNGSAKLYYVNLKHEELPTNNTVLSFINNLLSNTSQIPSGISSQPFKLNGTVVSIHSPVNIDVYDSVGNHTGLTINGDAEVNIPGSDYQTLDDAKFIWLPEDGKYTVKFTATGQGSFTYKIRTFKEDTNTKTVIFRNVPLTSKTKGEESLDTTADRPENLKLDQNGDGTIDQELQPSVTLEGSEYNDHTPSEAKFSFNSQTEEIEIQGEDNLGSVLVTDTEDGFITLKDENGNVTKLGIEDKNKKKKDKIVLQSITYDDNQPTNFPENRLVVIFKKDREGRIQLFEQKIVIKGEERIKAVYNPETNKTNIVIKEKGEEKKVETKEGIVSLILQTKNGDLVASY